MDVLLAFVIVVLIMGALGYALSHLSAPVIRSSKIRMSQIASNNTGTEAHGNSGKSKEPANRNTSNHISDNSENPASAQSNSLPIENQPDDIAIAALIEEVNKRLPQTQCAQCGHPGCRPYAQAIVVDHAAINQCPPGGEALIEELAEFLGTKVLPLDSNKGESKPAQTALIIEPDCIGCALCINACPVDAIVGASRYMHTVITDQCTGCELCLPPCPVDCIELHPIELPLHRWQWPKPA